MGFNQSYSHHTAATSDGGVSHSHSPRFSGPMTRRNQSFKRNPINNNNNNNNNTNNNNQNHHHHEIDLHNLNSPRSDPPFNSADWFDLKVEKKQRVHLKKPLTVVREKKRLGQWMFFFFCGVCLFLGVFKFSANGWFGFAIERAGFDRELELVPLQDSPKTFKNL